MHLRVRYADDKYDYSPDFMLDALISRRDIEAFYRPSEKRWIAIGRDETRGLESGLPQVRQGRRKTDAS